MYLTFNIIGKRLACPIQIKLMRRSFVQGPTELLQIMETRSASNMPSILKTPTSETLLVLQPPQSHRLAGPDFTDTGGTLPRPPPPPKVTKPPILAETQPLLTPQGSIQLISTHPGTLTRKHGQGKPMEELRVWQTEHQVDFRCLANDLNRICDQLNRSKPEAEEALYHVWRRAQGGCKTGA